MTDAVSQWYAVRTSTRREMTALEALSGKGFAVFLPMLTRWATPARRRVFVKEPVRQPLIPGLMFVMLNDPAQFDEVRAFEGVHGFLEYETNAGRVMPMPFQLKDVLGLQAEERAGLYDYTRGERVKYRPKKGDRVVIGAGAYYSFFAKVVATPRGERVHLMVEGGRGTHVDVDHVRAA